jgi:hypothetical protein
MSTEILITSLGAVLILFAIIVSINFMNIKIKVTLGIIGLLLVMYGAHSEFITMPPRIEQVATGNKLKVEFPVEKVQIISPLEGDSISCRVLAMGVYPESHDKDIWILLKPSDNRYYPQSDHTNTSFKRNGEWQVITRYGGDKGEAYDMIAYETDASASQFFSDTIQSWKDAKSYPGLKLEEIPKGAIEVDRIVVTLKDNCRGVF